MFNGNVTQTYNFQDASYEILFMLLGAFLLGCLLTWLLNKLFNKDYSTESNEYRYEYQGADDIHSLRQSDAFQANTTNEVKIVDKPTQQQPKLVTEPDDLTKISGVDSLMQTELNTIGISSFAGLRDINTKDLKSLQNKQPAKTREIETWPHQASLASKGEWKKLTDYQGFIHRVKAASTAPNDVKTVTTKIVSSKDELTKIVGITPEIETILNNNEIYSFKQLSHIDGDILKSHLSKVDSKFSEHETDSWSHQAAMADKDQWEELKVYQDFMHEDTVEASSVSSIPITTLKSDSNPAETVTALSSISPSIDSGNEDIEAILDASNENLSDHDDLKKIEGIGPKIEVILNDGGIYTFSQLYNSNKDRLRKLLDDAGSQYRMHNPDSWPHQAGMASRAEWDDLASYQHTLIQEQALNARNESKAREPKKTKKTTSTKKKQPNVVTPVKAKDDLRKIEGIGPKIEELLNNAGIVTFKALSEQTRDEIKGLLNEAGPQFRMHEPESWPHQAKLASDGKWQELEEYQNFLNGGRER